MNHIVNSSRYSNGTLNTTMAGTAYSALEHLLLQYPHKRWNWSNISKNPNISLAFVDAHPHLYWTTLELSKNPNLNLAYIQSHPERKWSTWELSVNPNFNLTWLQALLSKNWYENHWWGAKQIWGRMSYHHNLELKWLQAFPDQDWNWTIISVSPSLETSWFQAFPDADWNVQKLSKHPNLSIEWLHIFPEKNWNMVALSSHENLTLDWIKSFPEWEWIWKGFSSITGISTHSRVTLDWIKAFPVKWDWNALSQHPNLCLEWIQIFPNKPWNWSFILEQPHFNETWFDDAHVKRTLYDFDGVTSTLWKCCRFEITGRNVLNAWMYKDWVGRALSHNPHLEIMWIQEHPHQHWDWKHLSNHTRLTLDWLNALPNGTWDWKVIMNHPNCTLEWLEIIPIQALKTHVSYDNPLHVECLLHYITKSIVHTPSGKVIKPHDRTYIYKISNSRQLRLSLLHRFSDLPWCWTSISGNPMLDHTWVNAFPQKLWDWKRMAKNCFGWMSPVEYWSTRKEATVKCVKIIEEELIQQAWAPSRMIDWCWDLEERRAMMV